MTPFDKEEAERRYPDPPRVWETNPRIIIGYAGERAAYIAGREDERAAHIAGRESAKPTICRDCLLDIIDDAILDHVRSKGAVVDDAIDLSIAIEKAVHARRLEWLKSRGDDE